MSKKLRELSDYIDRFQSDEQVLEAVTAQYVRAIIRSRRLRSDFFDADLFFDPAWDILLDLYATELAQHRITVSAVCIGSAVPATTALRWIKLLETRGLLVRHSDPLDGRRVYLSLTAAASKKMSEYLSGQSISKLI
jgi:hypothetical protein